MFFYKKQSKFTFLIIGSLLFLNLFFWLWVYDLNKVKFLEVNFFNIGQGDAILIKTPKRYKILIDGGPDRTILKKLDKEISFYDRSLDLIILTHPEKDHISGLIDVLKKYKVKNILWTGILRDTLEWKEWNDLINKEKAQVRIAYFGQRIIFKNSNDYIYIDILNPFDNIEGKAFKNSNETSIVSHLLFKNISFLFTGDIGESTENTLIDKNIKSDVLKVPHHGSKYSSSEYFLEKVLPQVAVIQVGKNKYGHPHRDVLARFKKFDIQVLRNDIDGDIKIFSDGDKIKISTLKI